MGGRSIERRVYHHILQRALGAGFGNQAPLTLEGVARLTGCGADIHDEAGILNIRLDVSVVAKVVHYRAGTHAEREPAIGAVMAVIAGGKSVHGETLEQIGAAVVGGFHHHQLVGLGSVLWILKVDQCVVVMNGAQAIHVAFTEEVTSFADLLDQLLEGDLLPLASATLADPLEAVSHPKGAIQLAHHGITTSAGGGAVDLTLATISTDVAQRFGDRGAHGQVDRKSTRLNSSHVRISYAVFCLKKKK